MKPRRTIRNRAYYRHHRKRVIKRKKKIANQTYWHVKNHQYGRLAKGKVHCSCWMCCDKTSLHGYKKSEYVRLIDQRQQIIEFAN